MTVLPDRPPYKPDNTGPVIEQFISSAELTAGKTEIVSFGKPLDLESDEFYVKEWSI